MTCRSPEQDPLGNLVLNRSARLQQSIDRLSEGIQRIGLVLNSPSNPQQQKPQTMTDKKSSDTRSKPEETSKDNFSRPDMTQDEKKSQRAAKAAEKAARAEAAKAKKAAGVQGPASTQSNQSKKEKKGGDKVVKPQQSQKQDAVVIDKGASVQNGRSALKQADGKDKQPSDKEVKFNLSIKSESTDSLDTVSSVVQDRQPLEDASSIAHVHPEFLRLTIRCEKGLISEVDQLCQEFMEAFKQFVVDWQTMRSRDSADPKTTGHDLDLAIRPQLAHLTQDGRWPLPLALGNLVRQMKKEIRKIGSTDPQMRSRTIDNLLEWIDDCTMANFKLAYEAISEHLGKKMHATPMIVTYDWCPVVNSVLLDALEGKEKQRCCVVDAEMNGKGIRHVKSFIAKGIRCSYTDLKSVASVIKNSSMVLLGCSAVLSNGSIASPKGSMQLALLAKAFNVPLLVVAQSFKFVDKVQSYGRMALLGRESIELVPADLVTAVVTDIRILPPSSAPAVLKAKALDE